MAQRVHPVTRWRTSQQLTVSQSGSGALLAPADVPPVISSLPSPVFSAGVPSSYDMKQHVTDDGISTVTYALSNTLPVGLSFNPSTGILSYNGAGSIVDVLSTAIVRENAGPCYAGIRFASSGTTFENTGAGTSFGLTRETYITFGVSTGIWVERTITNGATLNWLDSGAGRLLCSTNPTFGVLQSLAGTTIAALRFDFYDQATGGVLLASCTPSLVATNDPGGGA